MLTLHSHSTAEQLSSKSEAESQTNNELSNLSEFIRKSYKSGETDGLQHALSSNNILTKLSTDLNTEDIANQLVGAAVEAAGENRGRLAAMINAIMASCCSGDESDINNKPSEHHPRIALEILDIMDEMHSVDAEVMVAPDIVSLSLVYYALDQSHQRHANQEFESESQAILERARRNAKKMAGSRRRKELAAERRRNTNVIMDARDMESQLRSLYGPDIGILQETKDVIVISKPAGMVTYHTKKTTAGTLTPSRKKKRRAANPNNSVGGKDGANRIDISLVGALLDIPLPLSTLNPTARGIVHRIDRGTSGAIILAKTDEIHLKLVASFFLRTAKKKYLALVPGCRITNGMDAGAGVDANNDPLELTMGSTGIIDVPVDGRPARSSYKVLNAFEKEQSSAPEALLLEVETLTGRKHQVRVHCASLGHPIFLDPLYSISNTEEKCNAKDEKKKKKRPSSNNAGEEQALTAPKAILDLLGDENNQHQHERFFLHASDLSIPELNISVNAPLPKWWIEAMDRLNRGDYE